MGSIAGAVSGAMVPTSQSGSIGALPCVAAMQVANYLVAFAWALKAFLRQPQHDGSVKCARLPRRCLRAAGHSLAASAAVTAERRRCECAVSGELLRHHVRVVTGRPRTCCECCCLRRRWT